MFNISRSMLTIILSIIHQCTGAHFLTTQPLLNPFAITIYCKNTFILTFKQNSLSSFFPIIFQTGCLVTIVLPFECFKIDVKKQKHFGELNDNIKSFLYIYRKMATNTHVNRLDLLSVSELFYGNCISKTTLPLRWQTKFCI